MSNKYIEKFFFLTEQNILTTESEQYVADGADKSQTFNDGRYLKYILAVLTGFVIYILAHNNPRNIELSKNIFPKFGKQKVIAEDETNRISIIPSFRFAARRQFLQEVPIKRMDLALLSASDAEKDYQQQVHVMDKVLVVPKLFG